MLGTHATFNCESTSAPPPPPPFLLFFFFFFALKPVEVNRGSGKWLIQKASPPFLLFCARKLLPTVPHSTRCSMLIRALLFPCAATFWSLSLSTYEPDTSILQDVFRAALLHHMIAWGEKILYIIYIYIHQRQNQSVELYSCTAPLYAKNIPRTVYYIRSLDLVGFSRSFAACCSAWLLHSFITHVACLGDRSSQICGWNIGPLE